MNLSGNIETILCKTAVAAGSSDVTDATVVDMADCEGVRFIFSFGAITSGAATSVGVAGKATNAPTPGTDDLTGTKITVVDTADDTLFIVDVSKNAILGYRYLRPFVKRATQNAVVNCIIAEKYGVRKMPVTQGATVGGQEIHVSEVVGTA